MVLETSVLSTFNHLTRLEARENFIKLSRRESLKSCIRAYCLSARTAFIVRRAVVRHALRSVTRLAPGKRPSVTGFI
jgi:hypothetical protein